MTCSHEALSARSNSVLLFLPRSRASGFWERLASPGDSHACHPGGLPAATGHARLQGRDNARNAGPTLSTAWRTVSEEGDRPSEWGGGQCRGGSEGTGSQSLPQPAPSQGLRRAEEASSGGSGKDGGPQGRGRARRLRAAGGGWAERVGPAAQPCSQGSGFRGDRRPPQR